MEIRQSVDDVVEKLYTLLRPCTASHLSTVHAHVPWNNRPCVLHFFFSVKSVLCFIHKKCCAYSSLGAFFLSTLLHTIHRYVLYISIDLCFLRSPPSFQVEIKAPPPFFASFNSHIVVPLSSGEEQQRSPCRSDQTDGVVVFLVVFDGNRSMMTAGLEKPNHVIVRISRCAIVLSALPCASTMANKATYERLSRARDLRLVFAEFPSWGVGLGHGVSQAGIWEDEGNRD
ncbi:hypothetical protein BJV74DRAFT_488722 [Russula compacta]|nr:hypothetical protein BJV74DRAFT_488722 [Russula compacta]